MVGRRCCGAAPFCPTLARRLTAGGAFNPEPPRGALGSADVTVVVPVRDRPAPLDRLLDQLASEDLACIVVDDASADAGATKEIAERHGAAFIGLATNVGPAGARNAGLAEVAQRVSRRSSTPTACPSGGWLGPLLGHFDDPVVAAVAPRIVAAGGPVRFEASRSSLDRGTAEGPVRPGSRIPFVPSAALLVRTDVALGSDLFDPALRGGEDVDLVWRLNEAGWDVRYVPSSTVTHGARTSLRDFLARRAFYGTTAGPLSRRHGEAVAPVHLSGWSLLVWTLLLLRRPVLALTALSASIVVLAARLRGLVRDPVGVATQIAGRGTTRSALPALASLTRAWAPALSWDWPFAEPVAPAPGLRPSRAARMGDRPACARPGHCGRGPRGRRRRLRRRRLGRLRPGADLGASHPADRLACPRVVDIRPTQGTAVCAAHGPLGLGVIPFTPST